MAVGAQAMRGCHWHTCPGTPGGFGWFRSFRCPWQQFWGSFHAGAGVGVAVGVSVVGAQAELAESPSSTPCTRGRS